MEYIIENDFDKINVDSHWFDKDLWPENPFCVQIKGENSVDSKYIIFTTGEHHNIVFLGGDVECPSSISKISLLEKFDDIEDKTFLIYQFDQFRNIYNKKWITPNSGGYDFLHKGLADHYCHVAKENFKLRMSQKESFKDYFLSIFSIRVIMAMRNNLKDVELNEQLCFDEFDYVVDLLFSDTEILIKNSKEFQLVLRFFNDMNVTNFNPDLFLYNVDDRRIKTKLALSSFKKSIMDTRDFLALLKIIFKQSLLSKRS